MENLDEYEILTMQEIEVNQDIALAWSESNE